MVELEEKKEKTIKIAVVGGRNFDDYDILKETFFKVIKGNGIDKSRVMIVSGGAKGADSLAQRLAKEEGLPILIFYPNWEKGKSAGLERNTKIVGSSDLIVAFPTPESRGTWDTIRKAERLGKKLYVVTRERECKPTKKKNGKVKPSPDLEPSL